ncbi:MAG: hypothetical protein WCB09_00020, partial [Methylocella sp.]
SAPAGMTHISPSCWHNFEMRLPFHRIGSRQLPSKRRLVTSWAMAVLEQPPDALTAPTGGKPAIEEMGTRAALATNSVMARSGNSGN